jgi:sodium-coupled neutral amino acid transporter 11
MMSILVILPLCLLRDISALSWTSLLSIIADIALILIVVACAPAVAKSEGIRTGQVTVYSPSVFAGVGAMSFAFVCQHNSFIVFRSLKESTIDNWKKVTT